ncbi:phage tail tape measure protein [Bacteroides koreensis]|uniref:Phage tail tape measure protein n=1 Tax=Bacteroides koreensis TaxID=1912896 RepID=A0ABU3IP48_9BACE|nr:MULTISPECIES: phage tail tape measure protein [Bacteroides]MDC2423343.1 phage tail tape measure protein [Bacteroides ovatus]MDC2546000.1 phage tail tape measure protein [Bacteroides ovatus]MDC2561263.1 phage tail tape measure protein [Bacteroides ovatus]MDC2566133.1 phage tail tape measure protein [Bacteroides ovatus]MDC2587264.1 phage tail tape measure protein [Bacteroides ovatus]
MMDLKLKDFVDENDLQKLVELDNIIERVRADYVNAAKELAKGLKLNVEGVADLEKLSNLYNTQAKTAGSASAELTEALRKQSEITQTVSKKIEEKLNVEKLSAAELKKLTKANSDNAVSLEKAAKAEANLTKAQNAGNTTRKKAVLSEEERLKLVRTAITLTNQEVHSRSQAKEMNKQLQKAVDVLKDTDENYIRTLARLNSTIGINTDYIKRNSDRYSQQKMTIGAYREEVKAAWVEIQNGNKSMQNMGIIARNAGKILNSEFAPGLSKVGAGLKGWAAGYIGAQAVVSGVVALFTKLREGVGSVVEFEFANSRLAAILGTTSDQIKELTLDAKRLGATTKYTASEATELQIELAKLGFTRKEILDATESVLRFAQATGAELGEAASLTGAALRMFNADTRETERYVSAMAVATTKSALSFSYLATALPIVGPVAKAFNFSIEDTLALLGKLSDAGFDASMSATATRNILLNLADTNGVLAKSLGGPVKTLPELVAGLQKLKEQGVDLNSTLEMTDKRSVAAFNAFLTAADKIVPLREQITGVEGELGDMAHTMEDNAKGAIDGLKSAWEALMISLGKNTGVLSGIINEFTDLVRSMRAVIATAEELGEERLANAARNGQEAAKLDKEWVKSKEESIDRVALKYRKEGVDGAEAFEKARGEQLKILERTLSQEEARLQLYTKRNQKQWSEYNNRSLLKQGLGLQKTTNQMKKDIDESFKLVEEQTAYVAGLKEKMEQIKGITNDYQEENTGSTFNKPLTDKEKRELEKAAKEKQKIKETYQESELALMDEGLEKELAKIGLAYSKKIAAVKGYSKEEIATRQNLAKEMQDKLDEFSIKYNSDREKKDVENALAVVKKGSQEELDLKLHQLELQREAEIDAAEKTGEDIFLIDDKYAKKKQELYERHASDQVQLIAENAAHEQEIRDAAYVMDTLALKKQLASKEITQQEYAELEYQLKLDYVRKTSEAAIDALESELATANLSTDKREKLEEKLAKLKADLAQKEAETEIDAINKVTKADEKAQKERQKNLKKWLQTASQAVGAIGNLVSSIYDGQIQKIEEEREANEEKYDEDIERIENLAESGAISEEEAEARKRAAKDQTEAKNKELEKQKQEIAHKQAVWHKGVQVAETGIATARGIMEAFQLGPIAGAVMAAVIGAMGAMQVATILATPIPSYAEGTKGNDRHPGGAALVGDAGKHEVIMYSGKAWITPDTPTLVDIPKGAQVFPDVDKVDISNFDIPDWDFPTFSPTYFASSSGDTIVFNDYSRLEKRVDRTNFLLMKSLKMQRQDASNREFELYKLSKLK